MNQGATSSSSQKQELFVRHIVDGAKLGAGPRDDARIARRIVEEVAG